MNKKIVLILSFIILSSFLGAPILAQETQPDPEFKPGYIIGDAEITNYTSMTQEEIQRFLESKGSYLSSYSAANPDGKKMKASEIIYDRCLTNKINPKFILVLLQKEQGLIEDPDPKQAQLDWATGYGCPDSGGCNARWQGLWKQINSATLQFFDYLENPLNYTYKAGQTYVFQNKYSTTVDGDVTVTIFNKGTAALYNYTPHVYNGNYNFWKLWKKYFTTAYPNGSLLQVKGEIGVWLIQNGQKRGFLSKNALTSRFDEKKIIIVDKSTIDAYITGAPIKFPNYSIVKSPGGKIFLLTDNKRRVFSSSAVFKAFGYNPEEVMNAGWEDINSYEEGAPLTATSTYPTGALLQDVKTGGVYWVSEGKKAPLLDRAFLTAKFKNKKIIKSTAAELAKYPTTAPILFGDGELLTSPTNRAVYLIADGKKRPFMSGELFLKLGYKFQNVISVSPQLLVNYENGEPIKENNF